MSQQTSRGSGTEPLYHGEDIVSDGSILRTLPNITDTPTRMRLDAIAFSADLLQQAWLTLRAVATEIGPSGKPPTRRQRALMFAAAWNIVDHLNTVNQLIRAAGSADEPMGPKTTALLSVLGPARRLRNAMDHLIQRIPNLAATKGRRPPIFGVLSYFLVPSVPITEGYSITLQAGMVHGKEQWPLVNPAGRVVAPPADLFTLSAFGESLELGPPIALLAKWIERLEVDIQSQLDAQIKALSKEHGHPPEKLREHSGAGYFLAVKMAFTEPVPEGDAD